MKKLCLVFVFFALLFLKPLQLHQTGLMYVHVGDDASYFAHAASIAFFNFPSYEKEVTHSPAHSIGAGLMAAPFVFLFSGVDRLQGHAVVKKRTVDNIKQSWSLFGFVVATNVYFLLALFFLYRSLSLFFDEKVVFWGLICLFFCQYFPLYLFQRPMLSHIYEFFLQSVFVSLFLTQFHAGFLPKAQIQTLVLLGCMAGLMILVRYNNVLFALMWPAVLLKMRNENKVNLFHTAKQVVLVWGIAFLIFGFFKILPVNQADSQVYIASTVSLLSEPQSLWFFVRRFFYVLGGPDWGLLFTGPFLLMGVCALVLSKDNVSKQLRFISLPILVNFYIVLIWATQGGWYGYRYMVFSLCPLIVFTFCVWIDKIQRHWKRPYAQIGFVLVTLMPMISMLSFEGNGSTLTLSFAEQPFGKLGWGNPFYHYEIVRLALSTPQTFFGVVLQGGFSYWFWAIVKGLGFDTPVFFNFEILTKSLILYGLPFVVLGLYGYAGKRLKEFMV